MHGTLAEYACQFSKAVRTAYSVSEFEARAGGETSDKASRKADIKARFELTSRQVNAVLVEADGHRDSMLELDKLRLDELQDNLRKQQGRIVRARATLTEHKKAKTRRLSKTKAEKVREALFQARTKVDKLKAIVAKLKERLRTGCTSLVFGTKKALRLRSDIDVRMDRAEVDNDTFALGELRKELEEWSRAWRLKRTGQFLVLGSKDETAGCQGCVATAEKDGSFTLSVRLPDAQGGGHLELPGLRFKYGEAELRYALAQQGVRAIAGRKAQAEANVKAEALAAQFPVSEELDTPTGAKPKKAKNAKVSGKDVNAGAALTWRFMDQGDGSWRVSFTTDVAVVPVITSALRGVVGVDINAGFITYAETDPSGNILYSRKLATPDVGLSAEQRKNAIALVIKRVIALCVLTGKPLVLEALDFQKKKRALQHRSPNSKRKLSALAYRALHDLFSARALDHGVEVRTIDPAYTSTQGWVRYAAQRGWSVHQAAAGTIGRRGQGLTERAPASGTRISVPVGGMAVEWEVPVDTCRSDASRRWPKIHRGLQKAIASHFRARQRAGPPDAAGRAS